MQTFATPRAVASTGARATTPRHVPNVVRWSGAAGALAALILLVASPLYIMMGTPPALSDAARYAEYLTAVSGVALATKLVDTIYVAGFIVFLAGLRELIRTRAAEYDWAATLAFGAGLVSSVIILVGNVLGAAAALDTYSAADAIVIRALTEGTLPAFGAIGLLMTALFLGAANSGILATNVLPKWIGWLGYIVAVVTLVAAGTIFGGNDFLNTTIWGGSASAGLYSYSTSTAGLLFVVWLLVVGIFMFRIASPEPPDLGRDGSG
jgi:hypothetical protein